MPYCLYLRKSRADMEAEQRGESETLARHESILLELASRQSLDITEIYREVVSGETISARPVMQKLLAEVEAGCWKGVLVVEVERLARGDTIDQGVIAQAFKYSDTKIITPTKIYDPNNEFDEEYFEFGLFMSRREYKTINRRLQRGRLLSVKEGKYVSNKPPYGYDRIKLESQKGYTLKPNEQAEIIKLIFKLYTKGENMYGGDKKRLGVSMIVRRLNELRIPPKYRESWTVASVRDILINPVYIGKIRWNWRPAQKNARNGKIQVSRPRNKKEDCIIADGLHEAIIDNETWELVQKYMAENKPCPVKKNFGVKNPLAGLIYCGKCGRSMTRRPYSKNQQDSLICTYTECDNISSYLHIVESKVLAGLQVWLENYKIQWIKENETNTNVSTELDLNETALKKLKNELSEFNIQLDNIHDLLEKGIYDTKKFLERSKIISEKIKKSQSEKEKLINIIESSKKNKESYTFIIPKIETLIDIYSSIDSAEEKNVLLKEVLDKIIYTKHVNGRWHNKPDDFVIEIYPKLPK